MASYTKRDNTWQGQFTRKGGLLNARHQAVADICALEFGPGRYASALKRPENCGQPEAAITGWGCSRMGSVPYSVRRRCRQAFQSRERRLANENEQRAAELDTTASGMKAACVGIDSSSIKIYNPKLYILEWIMQVSKWGNSLAIRLPASVVDALELHEGDDIEIVVAGSRHFEIAKKPSNRLLLDRLKQFRGRLPADFRFDRDEANGRG